MTFMVLHGPSCSFYINYSVADPGEGPGGHPLPLVLDQTEKKNFETSLGLLKVYFLLCVFIF